MQFLKHRLGNLTEKRRRMLAEAKLDVAANYVSLSGLARPTALDAQPMGWPEANKSNAIYNHGQPPVSGVTSVE